MSFLSRIILSFVSSLCILLSTFSDSNAQFSGAYEGMSFQGFLTDNAGNPIDSPQDIVIRLYDAATDGSQVWFVVYLGVPINNGIFNVTIEGGSPSFDSIALDEQLWLQVEVDEEIMGSRTPLMSAPYALSMRNMRVVPETDTEGPRIIGGYSGNGTGIAAWGATIAGGGAPRAGDTGNNFVVGGYGTVGGGLANRASYAATVAGGEGNTATGQHAVIAGGFSNFIDEDYASIGGGDDNAATGLYSTVAGGQDNVASAAHAAIGGGANNDATGTHSVVTGGEDNWAELQYGMIGGGKNNRTGASYAAILGGQDHVAGGSWSTIGGGTENETLGNYSTIGGGGFNHVEGFFATVPGGRTNRADGDYSFAAGNRARVRGAIEAGNSTGDEGTFVWADRSNPTVFFSSTGSNQFLIQATGGVGIDTNEPASQLHVAKANGGNNGVIVEAGEGDRVHFYWVSNQNLTIDTFRGSDSRRLPIAFQPNGGNVGIGTTSPSERLEVNGNVLANNVAVPSDARYKKDVSPLSGSLSRLGELRGVAYTFDREAFPEKEFSAGAQLGLIAQEVRDVFPELVNESESGYLSVNYMGLIPVLIEAIKEQEARIDALEAASCSSAESAESL